MKRKREIHTAAVSERRLASLAWPVVLETTIFYVAQILNAQILAAVSDESAAAAAAINSLSAALSFLVIATAQSGGIIVAQMLGAKRYDEVDALIPRLLRIQLIFGLMVSSFAMILAPSIGSWLGLEGRVALDAATLLRLGGASIFMQSIAQGGVALLRARGFTAIAMAVSLTANISNLLLAFILGPGLLGFPRLEMAGVSTGLLLGHTIGAILAIVLLLRFWPNPIIGRKKPSEHLAKPSLRAILAPAIPLAIEPFAYNTSQTAIAAIIAVLGTTSLTARHYSTTITNIPIIFSLSLSIAVQIQIGHLIGAGKTNIAHAKLMKVLKLAMLLCFASSTTLWLAGAPLMRIFSSNPEVIALGCSVLTVGIIMEFGRTANIIFIGSLKASGDVRFPALICILFSWGLSVPLAWYLGVTQKMGLSGVWIAMATDECVRGLIMYLRWSSRRWERYRLVPSAHSTNS